MQKRVLKMIFFVFVIILILTNTCYAKDFPEFIIYVDGVNGNDETGTGLTPTDAVKTFKKAYELLSSGGSIYIVNTITIEEEMILTDTTYQDVNVTMSLLENAKIEEIKRYVQPTAYETLTGFNIATNLKTLIKITQTGNLTIENLTIDGHKNVVENATPQLNSLAVEKTQVMISNLGILNLENTVLQNNHTNTNGGAIYNSNKLTITGGEIKNNNAGYGAAIYDFGQTAEITGTIFSDNATTSSGGAIISTGNIIIKNSKFYKNKGGAGGAIYVQGNVTLEDCELYDNESTGSGGVIFVSTDHKLKVKKSLMYNNLAQKYGGAIYANGEFIVEDSKLYDNVAVDGGAISAGSQKKPFSIKNSEIYNNTVTGIGGGIEGYGTYEIIGTKIYDNTASEGGGIWNKGTLTLTESTVNNNTASQKGNAIYQNGTLKLNNDVLIENDIYLCANKKVDVISQLPEEATYLITPSDYNLGQTIVTISNELEQIASDVLKNFKLQTKDKYVERPGDLNTSESISDKDIIISKINVTITYDSNSNEDDVEQMPESTHIYWQENVNLSEIIPNRDGYEFIGWQTNHDEMITEEELQKFLENLTEDTTLYANYEKKPEINNPDTFDNIGISMMGLVISSTILILTIIKLNKKIKNS